MTTDDDELDHHWRLRAACVDEPDPDLWFTGGSLHLELVAYAKSVCRGCPVFTECRAAVDRFEADQMPAWSFGVWAGETPSERRARREATG